jgi:hypothetical protein
MKRAIGILVVVLCNACGQASSPSAPTAIAGISPRAGAPPAASPAPVFPLPDALFKIHPDPPVGPAPLTVHFNMCKSSDSNPIVDLRYHVVFGDGDDDRGFCRFEHVYVKPGQYTATACVSDRVSYHEPGTCQTYTIVVTAGTGGPSLNCGAAFSGPASFNNLAPPACQLTVNVASSGDPGCGNPLTVNFAVNGAPVGGDSITCTPGQTCVAGLNVPKPAATETIQVTAGTASATPLTFKINTSCVIVP